MAVSTNNVSRESQSREYCLRWNNHQPNLVHFFGDLLSKESFVDVTLVSSEGRNLSCHKMILSSCSPYFQKLFEGNPCKHPIVILKDVEYDDLQAIITFIYHGEVNISQERISSVLMTASSLQVKGLAEVPPGDLKKSAVPATSFNRKRDRHLEKSESLTPTSTPQPSHSGPIHSNSWSALDEFNENSPLDVPRKKLKKSVSATATTGSGVSASSASTNGEHAATGSFESGVGASVSRSTDDSSGSGDMRGDVLQRSSSGPSSLQIVSHLPGKSRSLDQLHEREVISLDSELSSAGFSECHNFEEGQSGTQGTGYELDVADVKIETVSDGEIEFEDDNGEESFGHADNFDFNELNQTHPNDPSSSTLFHNTAHQFASSSHGPKGKRGRLLIRQPRIKRIENETGELYIDESRDPFSDRRNDADDDYPSSRFDKSTDEDPEEAVTVPIVTVSQSSPTPPSSPVEPPSPEPVLTVKKSFSAISSSIASSTSTSLLMVPHPTEAGSNSHHSGGAHLVKQISQPMLPSHSSVVQSSSGSNPVIRRQHSQPNPIQQQAAPTRLYTGTPSNPLKRPTLFQLFPTDSNHSSKDEDAHSGNAILFETGSYLQLVPTGDGTSRITITPAFSNVKEEKKETAGDVSPDVTLTLRDEAVSLDSSSAGEGSTPIHRAGHCPALRPGPALGCNFCWNSVDECGRILRRKTKYHCPECHINLCIVPCFQEYHEKADKKKARSFGKLGLPKPSSM